MKTLIISLCMALPLMGVAQDLPSKNQRSNVEVFGNCSMCKSRIEKAALEVNGVKYANWNIQSGDLQLIYNARKTHLDSVQSAVAISGHDTRDYKADSKVYKELPMCCQYVRKGETAKPGQMTKH
jgi:cation transport ATPase